MPEIAAFFSHDIDYGKAPLGTDRNRINCTVIFPVTVADVIFFFFFQWKSLIVLSFTLPVLTTWLETIPMTIALSVLKMVLAAI